jgi:cyclase
VNTLERLGIILAVATLFSCATPARRPASESATKHPDNPFAWYFASSRLEQDPRPWPSPFDPKSDPVYAHGEVFIPGVAPEDVFDVMAKSSHWTDFYPNSDQPHAPGNTSPSGILDSLDANVTFDWSTFSVVQHMQVKEFIRSPQESVLAWTGGSFENFIYHRWIMHAVQGGTEVVTEECEHGATPFLDQLLMNSALHATHQLWLENLKKYILKEPLGDLFAGNPSASTGDDPEVLGLNLSWFDMSEAKMVEKKLADGIYVLLGAGGNSLVIVGSSEAMVVDTKFDLGYGISKGATQLHEWTVSNLSVPVTKIVDTHYHYDHTFGNYLYGNVQIITHPKTPALMRSEEADWWNRHPEGLPNQVLSTEKTSMNVGAHEVQIYFAPAAAHTSGDLYLYLPAENLVMLGDIMFNTYYPFFDNHGGGSSITGTIQSLREIASQYPTATFLPGHGPLATASDVLKYADYLESVYKDVKLAQSKGLNAQEAARSFDMSQWKRKVLPSLHDGKLQFATARTAFLGAFHVIEANHE